ncbi:MAG: DoxX family membrane protein [Actinomycetota bacterium]|nr:DoxX family membrane protein [Actinomycetota bacterium]
MIIRSLRVAARMTTGSTYAVLGLDAVRSPGPRVDMAASTLAAIRKIVPLPADDEQVVRANAAVQALAGVVLITGTAQRWAALALIASLIPTTAAGHAFWNIENPLARKMQRTQFHKNMAMLGGLLFAICDDARPVLATE